MRRLPVTCRPRRALSQRLGRCRGVWPVAGSLLAQDGDVDLEHSLTNTHYLTFYILAKLLVSRPRVGRRWNRFQQITDHVVGAHFSLDWQIISHTTSPGTVRGISSIGMRAIEPHIGNITAHSAALVVGNNIKKSTVFDHGRFTVFFISKDAFNPTRYTPPPRSPVECLARYI